MLKLILGEEIAYTGLFEKGAGLTISYVPQDASWVQGSLRRFAEEYGLDESLFKAILRKVKGIHAM